MKIIDIQTVGGSLNGIQRSVDEAWNNPSSEFLAWAEKYEEVISCDGEGRFPWTFYLPRPADSFGAVMGEDGYFASEFLACNFNEGNQDLI